MAVVANVDMELEGRGDDRGRTGELHDFREDRPGMKKKYTNQLSIVPEVVAYSIYEHKKNIFHKKTLIFENDKYKKYKANMIF